MNQRPRRLRATAAMRALVAEHQLRPEDLVLPLFIMEGSGVRQPIPSMPGIERLSIDLACELALEAQELGIQAVAPFPVIPPDHKDSAGTEALNPDGLACRAVESLKEAAPDLLLIADVALDPYSSDGHDGIVINGRIDNDTTLPVLAQMGVLLASAGADIVAPSDMMDGRVGRIREALEQAGFTDVAILSYCCKYASAFYGPFRDALDSAPRFGDKKSYQMDPANRREALREASLDAAEGADILMVKPGLPYLDIVSMLREATPLPVAVYHVSGEYAMLKAAAHNGWIDYDRTLIETLLSFKRAGASMILTYAALDAARLLQRHR